MGAKLSTWIRTTATAVATVYFFTNVALAYTPEKNLWAQRRQHMEKNRADNRDNLLLASLPAASSPMALFQSLPTASKTTSALSEELAKTLPTGFVSKHQNLFNALHTTHGTIRKVWLPKTNGGNRVVVQIQDVHQNEDAQRHIGGAVEAMVQAGQADLVGLEGAFAPVNVKAFHDFEDRDVIGLTADYLLGSNLITGPVHTFMTTKATLPPLVGVDDKTHYDANVEAYRESAPRMEADKKALSSEKATLELVKETVFSRDLAAFDAVVGAYKDERATLADYVAALAPTNKTSHAGLLAQAFKMEKALDFDKVEQDRKAMIDVLVKNLSKSQIDQLVQESMGYRTGEVRYGEFYRYLQNLCRSVKVDLARFPHMDAYIRYVMLSNQIDGEKLMAELGQLQKERYAALAKTPEEKELVARSNELNLKSRLLNFALTPTEWKEYQSLNLSAYPSFEAFYKEAESRDGALANNLLASMEKANATRAVLVAGGYHSEGVAERLRDAGVSVVSFTPRIEKVDQGSNYLSIFTQEKTPLEKLFAGEKLFVTQPPFGESAITTAPAVAAATAVNESGNPKVAARVFVGLGGSAKAKVTALFANGGVTLRLMLANAKNAVEIIVKNVGGKLTVTQKAIAIGFVLSLAVYFAPMLHGTFNVLTVATAFSGMTFGLGLLIPGFLLIGAIIALVLWLRVDPMVRANFLSASDNFRQGVGAIKIRLLVIPLLALTLLTARPENAVASNPGIFAASSSSEFIKVSGNNLSYPSNGVVVPPNILQLIANRWALEHTKRLDISLVGDKARIIYELSGEYAGTKFYFPKMNGPFKIQVTLSGLRIGKKVEIKPQDNNETKIVVGNGTHTLEFPNGGNFVTIGIVKGLSGGSGEVYVGVSVPSSGNKNPEQRNSPEMKTIDNMKKLILDVNQLRANVWAWENIKSIAISVSKDAEATFKYSLKGPYAGTKIYFDQTRGPVQVEVSGLKGGQEIQLKPQDNTEHMQVVGNGTHNLIFPNGGNHVTIGFTKELTGEEGQFSIRVKVPERRPLIYTEDAKNVIGNFVQGADSRKLLGKLGLFVGIVTFPSDPDSITKYELKGPASEKRWGKILKTSGVGGLLMSPLLALAGDNGLVYLALNYVVSSLIVIAVFVIPILLILWGAYKIIKYITSNPALADLERNGQGFVSESIQSAPLGPIAILNSKDSPHHHAIERIYEYAKSLNHHARIDPSFDPNKGYISGQLKELLGDVPQAAIIGIPLPFSIEQADYSEFFAEVNQSLVDGGIFHFTIPYDSDGETSEKHIDNLGISLMNAGFIINKVEDTKSGKELSVVKIVSTINDVSYFAGFGRVDAVFFNKSLMSPTELLRYVFPQQSKLTDFDGQDRNIYTVYTVTPFVNRMALWGYERQNEHYVKSFKENLRELSRQNVNLTVMGILNALVGGATSRKGIEADIRKLTIEEVTVNSHEELASAVRLAKTIEVANAVIKDQGGQGIRLSLTPSASVTSNQIKEALSGVATDIWHVKAESSKEKYELDEYVAGMEEALIHFNAKPDTINFRFINQPNIRVNTGMINTMASGNEGPLKQLLAQSLLALFNGERWLTMDVFDTMLKAAVFASKNA